MSEIINAPVFKKVELILKNEFEGVLSEELKTKSSSILDGIQMPTTRTEAWKYTRLGKINNKKFTIRKGDVSDISSFIIAKDAYTLVFVNGFLNSTLSSGALPEGIVFTSINEGKSDSTFAKYIGKNLRLEEEVFNSLNTLNSADGVFIHIGSKVILDKPLQILHILSETNTISNVRNLIVCAKNSEAKIIQGYFSEDATDSFTNVVTEVFVEENAHLTIDKIQYENDSCYQVATEQVQQEKNSTFTINTVTLNGAIVRNNLNIEVVGQNCLTNLNGTYLLKGNQHVDNHTIVDHKAPNCESHELYKGVVNDQSTAVFNGKVFVRKDAQKINAFQSNANVLLSDESTVNSKPELEIYADDVKCSHGSSTGILDPEQVFYLRSRGISLDKARSLLLTAYASEIVEHIPHPSLRESAAQLISERI